MQSFFPNRALLYLSLLSIPLTVSAQNGLVAWATPALQRTMQTDAAQTATSISIAAAKGEYESFQVVVRAPAGGLTGLNMTVSDLIGPSGAIISHSNFTLYREWYVDVNHPSPDFGIGNRPMGAGWYPDALIPFNDDNGVPLKGAMYEAVPATVAASQNQPFWIDVLVPRSAVAGDYSGIVTMTSDQGSFIVTVFLHVWNFSLPVQPLLQSSFGYQAAQVSTANNQLLIQHRLMPFVVNPSDVPSLMNLGLNAAGLPDYNESNSSTCTVQAPPPVSTLGSQAALFPSSLSTYIYVADEIDFTTCTGAAANLAAWTREAHQMGTKVLATTPPVASIMDDGSGTGRPAADIFVMLPKTQYTASPSLISQVLAKGAAIWSYNALEQDEYSPKWLLDFAPINYRIMPGVFSLGYNFTGILYAGVDRWEGDPWTNVNVQASGGYYFPGEAVLTYTGGPVGLSHVVPSLRLKFLRDGVDDFDYLTMLVQQGQSSFVRQTLAPLVTDWITWSKDPVLFESVRRQWGNELELLAGGGSTPPPLSSPPPSNPPPSNPPPSNPPPSNPPTTLAVPSNPSPANQATGVPSAGTVTWSAVSGASSYDIYYGTGANSLSLTATVSSLSLSYSGLTSRKTYYWKVVAKNGATSTSGPIWSLTIR